MSFWSDLESVGSSIVNAGESAISGAANVVEGAAGEAVNLAGGVLKTAEGIACPLLSDVMSPLQSILGGLLGGGQSSPLPFSGASSLINDPAQFATNLSSASDSLGQGVDLSGVSGLEQTANQLEAKAEASGSETDAIQAQQAAEKLNQVVSLITTALSERASLDDKISNNLKTQ